MPQQTAILIFTRTSGAEAKHKLSGDRLSYGTNQKICAELIAKTRRVAQQTNFSVIEIDSTQQIGNSLGERLSNSIAAVFQAGFEQVLVIGTDTPDISRDLLQKAAQQISQTQATLGASKDGGAYLIGFHQAQFDKTNFSNLEWESDTAFDALVDYFATQGTAIYSTKTLQDIDSFYDLMQFLKRSTPSLFVRTLQQLVDSSTASTKPSTYFFQMNKGYNIYNYNRPPPFHV
jgi:glycosyltransferase A (GT-A) superfamily protein (DUF2064 family)